MKNLNFLVIDQDNTMRGFVINLLKKISSGRYFGAKETEDAYISLKTNSIDFVIMDLGNNNFELIKRIRESIYTFIKKVPIVVAVKVGEDESYKEKLKEAGANGFITKPFTSLLLKRKIEEILNKSA